MCQARCPAPQAGRPPYPGKAEIQQARQGSDFSQGVHHPADFPRRVVVREPDPHQTASCLQTQPLDHAQRVEMPVPDKDASLTQVLRHFLRVPIAQRYPECRRAFLEAVGICDPTARFTARLSLLARDGQPLPQQSDHGSLLRLQIGQVAAGELLFGLLPQ